MPIASSVQRDVYLWVDPYPNTGVCVPRPYVCHDGPINDVWLAADVCSWSLVEMCARDRWEMCT